ncbi:MAG: preprotein translocase subunit SecA [Deltaproteobacteria bacterium]|nr:MAG: preprotein translocase subunit SecA [Deltaproteobacteria bacterium]
MFLTANPIKKIFGTKNERDLKRLAPMVDQVNEFETKMRSLNDAELAAATERFRESLDQGASLEDILPEAFAVVREASVRTLGMRPFDVQVIGGIVLHQGKIAEMKTGEGKTLAATMPVYLNALTGRGVHVITVNDYLARRDAEWMGAIYTFLGLSVGVITHNLDDQERQRAYAADVTYGTNNEFGFDYLRDNMKFSRRDCVQRELHYAIVDEVDSILIDEARTPLIISGPVEYSIKDYEKLRAPVANLFQRQQKLAGQLIGETNKLLDEGQEYEGSEMLLRAHRAAPKHSRVLEMLEDGKMRKLLKNVEQDYSLAKRLPEVDESLLYVVEEKERNVYPTERGKDIIAKNDPDFFVLPELEIEVDRIERDNTLTAEEKAELQYGIRSEYEQKLTRNHVINQLLKAYALFAKDVDYVVKDGQIVIVDEFTGRLMPGRRYSDGLHQALEAKEGVRVEQENQTLATVTFQNYFRMYEKLAGMTGTADTEAAEFAKIYNLEVMIIPSNKKMIRKDNPDVIYKTEREKFKAVVEEIKELARMERPALVGTASIERSERLSKMLSKEGVKHSVLNAKNHEKEAEIVAKAGQKGAVTISTNMAGRGTDIVLGPGVVDMGGLHIIGTERHEARRIDNQLRGRAGRQGDPGSSRFYLSLEDDLMRIFAAERIANLMDRVGMEEGHPIEHALISRAIENAQKKVETQNFNIRKQLLEYDDVMNQQREIIYEQRRQALEEQDLQPVILDIIEDIVIDLVESHIQEDTHPEEWDLRVLEEGFLNHFSLPLNLGGVAEDDLTPAGVREFLLKLAHEGYAQKEQQWGPDITRDMERLITLQTVDRRWRENLLAMDQLKEGIGLRGYAQQNPLIEYKREGLAMFQEMIDQIKLEIVQTLFRVQVATQEQAEQLEEAQQQPLFFSHGDSAAGPKKQPVKRSAKIGRNQPCPCGSGKKYKKCCGR